MNSEKIKSLELDSRVVGVNNTLFNPVVIKKSLGFMGNIGLNAFKTNFIISYWYSTDFVSDFGGFSLSSASTSMRTFIQVNQVLYGIPMPMKNIVVY